MERVFESVQVRTGEAGGGGGGGGGGGRLKTYRFYGYVLYKWSLRAFA